MKLLMKLKPWQIFLIVLTGYVLQVFTLPEPMMNALAKVFGMILYSLYPICIGHFLQDALPKKVEMYHSFFLVNVFIWITLYALAMIWSGGVDITFNGIWAIPGMYALFAYIYMLYFSAKTLKSADRNREAKFSDYVGEFFLLVFLPIGLWILHPKVREIAGRPIEEEE